MATLSAQGLCWTRPDGRPLFADLDLHLPPGRAGLVGANGIGKSTLLALLSGRLAPTAGGLRVEGTLALLPQDLSPLRGGTVAAALGLGAPWEAWKRVRAGEGREDDFDFLAAAGWDLEERLEAALRAAGLPGLDPDRDAAGLSGGELVRAAFAGVRLRGADILLLDEPTNHLDAGAREAFLESAAEWRGVLLAASHDRALLRIMDRILELSNLGLAVYGGGYDFHAERKRAEDAAAEAEAEARAAALRLERRERQEALARQEKRSRAGARAAEAGGMPKILLGMRKRRAEGTSARLRDVHDGRVAAGEAELAAARARLREDPRITVDLDPAAPPARKLLARAEGVNHVFPDGTRLWAAPLDFELRGAARTSLAGDNGAGKSLLVRMLQGAFPPSEGRLAVGMAPTVLDQHVVFLDPAASVLDNVRRFARAGLAEHELRQRLGRFRFPGDEVLKPAAALSGGERMRAGLACLLAGDNAPAFLILDEPTNNLDFAAREAVESALSGFRGGLLVISHDAEFLEALGVEAEIRLERDPGR